MLNKIKKIIPQPILKVILPAYHWTLALVGAIIYGFPSRKIKVIGVTGTKGKTSTVEIVNAILEEAGYKTAIASTLRFKIGTKTERNLLKMTTPGRFFLQRFIHKAVEEGCQYITIEMSSEGARYFRHKFIYMDALIFTNLAPEHIDSHGSYENYVAAKLKLAKALETSPKENRAIIANADDREGAKFLAINVPRKFPFSLDDAVPYIARDSGVELSIDNTRISSTLPGVFSIYNILAGVMLAKSQGIGIEIVKKAMDKFKGVPGRAERITPTVAWPSPKDEFTVIVDYAHTPDSLKSIYEAFKDKKKVCVLGSCGGGRDRWKRPVMAKLAEDYCLRVILTNEDPYDEDPKQIINDLASGIKSGKYDVIMDRREAIREAIRSAPKGGVVMITGKGTDPYIMGPNGTKVVWSDADVSREELDAYIQELAAQTRNPYSQN